MPSGVIFISPFERDEVWRFKVWPSIVNWPLVDFILGDAAAMASWPFLSI